MERQSRNPTLPNVDTSRQLGNLLIHKGLITREQLSQALQEQRDKGGRLGEVLVRLQVLDELTLGTTLAEHFDSRDRIAKKIRGAVAYPIFAVSMITLIVIGIMTFIVPRFRTIFDQLGGQLPAFTRGFMGFYDMFCQHLLYVGAAAGLVGGTAVLLSRTKGGRDLSAILRKTSDHYERRIAATIDTMTRLLEPIMIATIGVIVLVVVIALYLPIFTMSNAIH